MADEVLVRWLLDRAVELGTDPRGSGDEASVEEVMRSVVERNVPVFSAARRQRLIDVLVAEAQGLGAIEKLLADPDVTEVMVNGPDEVWAERRGVLERTSITFRSEVALREAIDRLLATAGRRADELSPMADARLPDGSRLNVVLPPLSQVGPTMTIRRFGAKALSLPELVVNGTLSEGDASNLRELILAGENIVICGATGSGKSTTLAALAAEVPKTDRIITIEDTAELRIAHPHVVALETRPVGSGGQGQVTTRDLVRNALRMRPDHLLVGEVRGAEALDMIDALATGHRGSLSTVHAASPAGAITRIVQLALQAASGLSEESIRERANDAIDVVVMQVRREDGKRLITDICRTPISEK